MADLGTSVSVERLVGPVHEPYGTLCGLESTLRTIFSTITSIPYATMIWGITIMRTPALLGRMSPSLIVNRVAVDFFIVIS
jgi:hypothetical protein